MLLVCSYQDCLNIRYPCSPLTFFSLPKDHRRKIWIKHSGNKNLNNISETSTRYFCEQHFNPKHIRRQFNRCILHKFAEPYKYIPKTNDIQLVNNENTDNEEIEIKDCTNASYNTVNSKIINDLSVLYPNDTIGSLTFKPTIEDTINEYIITSNDNIETQLDFAIKESAESIEITEDRDYEEILINPINSEPVDITNQVEVNGISLIESVVDPNQDFVSPENEEIKSNDNDYENDKHFALSLVGNFQRLSLHKKAIAKLKILQYLTELEFSETTTHNNILLE